MPEKKVLLRLPVTGYKLELPEILQALLMVSVGFSAVPVLQETLGMSYAVALTTVAIAEFLGLLHVTLSDPVVPGWIASALPLVLAYLGGFASVNAAVQGMIALQLWVGLICIVVGFSGLGAMLMRVVPASLRAAILLGSAIVAAGRILGEAGYFHQYPVAVGLGGIVTLFILFSQRMKIFKDKNKVLRELGKYGMLPGVVIAMVAGLIAGEIALPRIEWGFIPFSFGELFRDYSVFSIGLPPLKVFLGALPMALAVYIVAFGEIVTADSVLKEAEAARPEEPIDFDTGRTNIIAGSRNIILALFAPFTALAGPLWAAVTVSISERYKEGKKAMSSIYSGMGSFKLSTAICVLLMPLASFLQPVLPIALALTLLVQAYACSYIAIEQVKNNKTAAGIAGISGAAIYFMGLNSGLVVGIILCLLLEKGVISFSRKER